MCRLRVHAQAPAGREILIQKRTPHPVCRRLVPADIGAVSQRGCGGRAYGKIAPQEQIGDIVMLGASVARLRRHAVPGEPIPEGECPPDQPPPCFARKQAVRVGLHERIVPLQRLPTSVTLVQCPREKHTHIRPSGSSRACFPLQGRCIHGQVAGIVANLLNAQIIQILFIKCPAVGEIARRSGEYPCIGSPAEALVPLRAVGRNVHEVGKLSPARGGNQCARFRAVAGK